MEYDFNEHIVKILRNRFGGSERKETVLLDDGKIYLLKLPDPTREKDREISYINNVISEYLGCKIFASVGLNVQKVILGTYTNENGKTSLACACENIIPDGYVLAEADKQSMGSDCDTKQASCPQFATLDLMVKNSDDISREELGCWYADLFVMDAFIGNTDRHNGNWGFLSSKDGDRIAPIYDCGSSFSPLLSDEELTEKQAQLDARNVASAIQDENGTRIRYHDYLMSGNHSEVSEALKRMVPRIRMDVIENIIWETPYISERRKKFYVCLLQERYTKTLLPALEQVHEREINVSETEDKVDDLYGEYKQWIAPLTQINIGETKKIQMGAEVCIAERLTNKYVDLVKEGTAESLALLSVRSNNRDVRKSVALLKACFPGAEKTCVLGKGTENAVYAEKSKRKKISR